MRKLITFCLPLILGSLCFLGLRLTPNHFPVNREGLVGWYDYRNTGSISALGTWKDYSGSGNDGTLVGDAYINNTGMVSDGSGDYATTGYTNVNFDYDDSFTFSMSFNISQGTAMIYSSAQTSTVRGIEIFLRTDEKLCFGFYSDYGSNQYLEIYSASTVHNQDITVDIVYHGDSSAANTDIYVNGETTTPAVGSNTLGTNTASHTGTRWIGCRNGIYSLNGNIKRLLIYNRALSAGEIKLNYLKNMR